MLYIDTAINIKPFEISLGNLDSFNKNYDKKIKIFNGKILKTYVLNVEKENYFDYCKSERINLDSNDKTLSFRKSFCNTARNLRTPVQQSNKKFKLQGKDSFKSMNLNFSLTKHKNINDKEDTWKNSKTPIINKFSTSASFSNIATTRKEEITIERLNSFYGIKFSTKKDYHQKLLSKSNKSLFKNHDFYYN